MECGANVIGVDPRPMAELPPGVDVRNETYRTEHLSGASLAFAAGPPGVNRQVVADARRLGIWVNSASEPGSGDFTLPATWRDGPITLTISTGGASPALARHLRDRAALALGPAAATLAVLLAELRPMALARLPDPALRRRVLAQWADPAWLDRIEAEGPEAIRRSLLADLDPAGWDRE